MPEEKGMSTGMTDVLGGSTIAGLSPTDLQQGLLSSVIYKTPCAVATTANHALSGLSAIDGYTPSADDRVLVWQQTDASENGIYLAASGAWSRALDFNGNYDATVGTQVFVINGSTHALGQFYVSAIGTIGTDDTTFAEKADASASAVLNALLIVDGAGSGLDSDKLDGQHGTYFLDRTNHTGEQAISTVTGLQAALDLKAPLASPTFTGVPAGPTAAPGTNTTQFSTTAFVAAAITALSLGTMSQQAAADYSTTASIAATYLTQANAAATYQPVDGDLSAIAALAGTTGFLIKTAANTWALDTSTYLTTASAAASYQPLAAVLTGTTASFTSALETKLNGIEALADVTDTANVTAAGALMDSEVASLSGVKTLTVPDSATISAYGATVTAAVDAAAARAVLGVGTGTGDLISTNNLSDLTDASAARTNLGLVIGTDVAPVASPTFTGTITLPSGAWASTGEVGIGTAATSSGFLSIERSAGAAANGEIYTTDGTQWARFNTNTSALAYNGLVAAGDHTIIFSAGTVDTGGLTIGPWTAGTKGIRIDDSGYVGLGTSPDAPLHVAGADSGMIAHIAGATRSIRIGADGTGSIIEGVDNTGIGSYQPLTIGGSDVRLTVSSVEIARVTSAGLGIGAGASFYFPDGSYQRSAFVSVFNYLTDAQIAAVQNSATSAAISGLAAAINGALASGVRLAFPPGYYWVDDNITLASAGNVAIIGAGMLLTKFIFTSTTAGEAGVLIDHGTQSTTGYNCELCDFSVWSPGASQTNNDGVTVASYKGYTNIFTGPKLSNILVCGMTDLDAGPGAYTYYWRNGFKINAGYAQMNRLYAFGKDESNPAAGISGSNMDAGIWLIDSTDWCLSEWRTIFANYGVKISVTSATGAAPNNSEGSRIKDGTALACNMGVYASDQDYGGPQHVISSNHFATYKRGVQTEGLYDVAVFANQFQRREDGYSVTDYVSVSLANGASSGCSRAFVHDNAMSDVIYIAVTNASGTGATVTLTHGTLGNAVAVGASIVVSGMNPAGYNGTYTVTASTTTTTSYSHTESGAFVSGGVIRQQNSYMCLVGTMASAVQIHHNVGDNMYNGINMQGGAVNRGIRWEANTLRNVVNEITDDGSSSINTPAPSATTLTMGL